jgi:hypothetical protein
MKWLRSLFGGVRKSAPPFIATVQKESGNVYAIRIGGVLTKQTTDRIQTILLVEIERGGKDLKLLVNLSGFEGWRKGDEWGDTDFFGRYADDIARIAAVVEERWREQALILLAGRRRGEVHYFTPEEGRQARAWLAA